MKTCIICGEPTNSPLREFLWHFRLVEWGQWRFWRGNIQAFGWFGGMRGNLTLSFPFLNTLINWKYRNARLVFPRDWKP